MSGGLTIDDDAAWIGQWLNGVCFVCTALMYEIMKYKIHVFFLVHSPVKVTNCGDVV